MTTELEKQFFDTFNINPYFDPYLGYTYPQITDEHYLELICVLSVYMNEIDNIQLITAENMDSLKEDILKDCIVCKDQIKNKVEIVFKD